MMFIDSPGIDVAELEAKCSFGLHVLRWLACWTGRFADF